MRFVLLSMLLHATIVILFGTSHGGGAGRGEGMLDVLDVTFRRQPVPEAGLLPGPGAATAPGRALLPPTAPQTTVAPTRSNPMPEPARSGEPTSPEAVAPLPQPAVEPLPRIDLRAPQEVDKPLVPPLIAPPAVERLVPPPSPADLVAPPDIAPPAIPQVPAAPIERLSAPAVQHELAPPPAPVPAVPPIERLAAPAAPKSVAPPIEVPLREAPILPAPIDRLAVPRVDRELAPAPSLVAPGPPVAALPAETAPAQVERTAPPVAAKPAPAASEGAIPAPDARTAPGAPSAPATAAPPPRLRLGSPGPDEDMFKPRRDVAAPGEDGVPRIDMDAARQRAREIASESTSTRGILPALPPPPERQSKESHALEKAVKPDCRTAYAGLGLLAVPVLVASTIGDAGCRW